MEPIKFKENKARISFDKFERGDEDAFEVTVRGNFEGTPSVKPRPEDFEVTVEFGFVNGEFVVEVVPFVTGSANPIEIAISPDHCDQAEVRINKQGEMVPIVKGE